MKKITFMTMAMVSAMTAGTAMTFVSCSEAGSLKTSISTDNDSYVVTEGKIVKQYRKVGKFISVRIEGSPTVKFVQGDKHEVIVQGTKEYVDKIKIVVEGNKLVVGLKNNISFNIFKNRSDRKNLVVYVTSPDLVGVELAGSGDFICKGPIDTDRLNIQVNGSGDVALSEAFSINKNGKIEKIKIKPWIEKGNYHNSSLNTAKKFDKQKNN